MVPPGARPCPPPQMKLSPPKTEFSTSLVVQRLRLHTSTAEDVGFIPGQEIKILMPCGAAKKRGGDINLSIIEEEGLAKENSSVFFILFVGISPQYRLPLLLTQLCILPALAQFFSAVCESTLVLIQLTLLASHLLHTSFLAPVTQPYNCNYLQLFL